MHRVANALFLHPFEFVVVDTVAGVLFERLAQRRRPQQTANMVGPERRATIRADAHYRSSPPAVPLNSDRSRGTRRCMTATAPVNCEALRRKSAPLLLCERA